MSEKIVMSEPFKKTHVIPINQIKNDSCVLYLGWAVPKSSGQLVCFLEPRVVLALAGKVSPCICMLQVVWQP